MITDYAQAAREHVAVRIGKHPDEISGLMESDGAIKAEVESIREMLARVHFQASKGTTGWDDAALVALTRDTSVWTPAGDWYDVRGHLLLLYNCAKWINWPNPSSPLPSKKTICVEIGVREGVSSLALLHAMQETGGQLVSVDCDEDGTKAAIDGIERAGLSKWWDFHCITSDQFASDVLPGLGKIDMLWIDGCHRIDQVRKDAENYVPSVRVGGLVFFHDTANADASGPNTVVAELIETGKYYAFTFPWSCGCSVLEVRG